MNTQDRVRQIMASKELASTEKRDQLHALIPADVFKIDNLNEATPAQLRQLNEALAVAPSIAKAQRRSAGQFKLAPHCPLQTRSYQSWSVDSAGTKLHEFLSHQTRACRMSSFSSEPVKCRISRSPAFS